MLIRLSVIRIGYTKLRAAKAAVEFILKQNDIIYVPNKLKDKYEVLSKITGTLDLCKLNQVPAVIQTQ